MAKFKIGDLVQLNSGGLKMTVVSYNGNKVFCRWFRGREWFSEVMLRKMS